MKKWQHRTRNVPSRTHEIRRSQLETVASAAGYHLPMYLPDGRRPDVLRLHIERPSLFLGEAKHTEGPTDAASTERLYHYVEWLVPLYRKGISSILAVGHPRGTELQWQERMSWLCHSLGLFGAVDSSALTPRTSVTFGTFRQSD